jgi:hypothetical protein
VRDDGGDLAGGEVGVAVGKDHPALLPLSTFMLEISNSARRQLMLAVAKTLKTNHSCQQS